LPMEPCQAVKMNDAVQALASPFPPRLSPAEAERFAGLTSRQLKGLRERRMVRFYRLGRRTLVYDRDSLATLLAAGMVDAMPTR